MVFTFITPPLPGFCNTLATFGIFFTACSNWSNVMCTGGNKLKHMLRTTVRMQKPNASDTAQWRTCRNQCARTFPVSRWRTTPRWVETTSRTSQTLSAFCFHCVQKRCLHAFIFLSLWPRGIYHKTPFLYLHADMCSWPRGIHHKTSLSSREFCKKTRWSLCLNFCRNFQQKFGMRWAGHQTAFGRNHCQIPKNYRIVFGWQFLAISFQFTQKPNDVLKGRLIVPFQSFKLPQSNKSPLETVTHVFFFAHMHERTPTRTEWKINEAHSLDAWGCKTVTLFGNPQVCHSSGNYTKHAAKRPRHGTHRHRCQHRQRLPPCGQNEKKSNKHFSDKISSFSDLKCLQRKKLLPTICRGCGCWTCDWKLASTEASSSDGSDDPFHHSAPQRRPQRTHDRHDSGNFAFSSEPKSEGRSRNLNGCFTTFVRLREFIHLIQFCCDIQMRNGMKNMGMPDVTKPNECGDKCGANVSTILLDDLLEVVPFRKAFIKIDVEVKNSSTFNAQCIHSQHVFFLKKTLFVSRVTSTKSSNTRRSCFQQSKSTTSSWSGFSCELTTRKTRCYWKCLNCSRNMGWARLATKVNPFDWINGRRVGRQKFGGDACRSSF